MKKRPLILLISCLLFSCGSTSNNQSKIIIEGSFSMNTYQDISLSQLENKIENNDDFILYIYSPSCLGCQDFKGVINSYITSEKALIYGINVDEQKLETDNQFVSYRYTPTIAIFKDGSVISKIDSKTNEKAFVSYQNLSDYLKEFVVVSSLKVISSVSELDEVIKLEKTFVYFYYSKCGDCIAFDNLFFKEYCKNEINNLYGFDVAYYFENREDSNSKIWTDFTAKYGLSSSGSSYGYKNGVVPTIIEYKQSNIEDERVIFNDELEKETNENNEVIAVKVLSSYYQDNPFIGQRFARTSDKTAMSIYREKTLEYYSKKIKEILK